MTSILIIGGVSKLYHNIHKIGPIFRDFLTQEGYSVTITEDMDYLLPENLKKYDAIIDYTTHQLTTESQAESLLTRIRQNSIVYMGIHGASTSYYDSERILEMIGARFVKHPPIRKIKVIVEEIDHPFMKGVSNFTIRDELYLQEYFPPFQILLSTQFKRQNIPLAWIKPYGNGIVFYLALGHGPDQLNRGEIQQIIKNVINASLSD
jgi:type 1 glutamine amidotransferase